MSRSQRGMNHLGSGHVLTNTPTSSQGANPDNCPIRDTQRNRLLFAANR
jgi:hypothetical protein